VRRLQHGGSTHFVVDQPDGTRGLLPAWMAEPWSAQIATIELPRLPLGALRTLRSVIDSALVSLSSSATIKEKCDDGPVSRLPAARSACQAELPIAARSGCRIEDGAVMPKPRARARYRQVRSRHLSPGGVDVDTLRGRMVRFVGTRSRHRIKQRRLSRRLGQPMSRSISARLIRLFCGYKLPAGFLPLRTCFWLLQSLAGLCPVKR